MNPLNTVTSSAIEDSEMPIAQPTPDSTSGLKHEADAGPLLSYVDAVDAGPAIVGGKGWNLGRLALYGFNVPLGGVLGAGGDREHLASAGVDATLVGLAAVPAAAADAPETVVHLDAMRAAIE